ALARTCRTFKEPALDTLWSELSDLRPLARCLPNSLVLITLASDNPSKCYLFKRPVEEIEWDTLRSYARRIRSVLNFGSALYPNCVRTFLSPPTPEPLFPNLRYLRCVFANEITPLLHQPLPSLVSLDYSESTLAPKCIRILSQFSPNIKKLSIRLDEPRPMFNKLISNYICRWSKPQAVYCPQITLDMHDLTHLSRAPSLTQLSFALNTDAIPPSDTLLFSTSRELKLFPEPSLLSLTDFAFEIGGYLSEQSITSSLVALQPSGMGDSITRLRLTQTHHSITFVRPNPLVLTADDLRPIMALRNLRCIDLNLGWNVDLTDTDLLELMSAWPHLGHLLINEVWGWQTFSGITPDGLVHLLQMCQSLRQLSVAIDTRGYTSLPRMRSPAHLGVDLSPSFSINVVDSVIDAASEPALATFFANLVPSARCSLRAWSSWVFTWRTDKEVYARATEAVARRSVVSA
ncbi:hypothetical protein V8E55_004319, partial [Tylopilus felleus]